MANSGYVVGVYSGRPSNDAILEVWRHSSNSANQTRWSWRLTARKFGATSYVLDAKPWSVNVEGDTWSGSHNLDFRNTSSIVIASGTTGWKTHNSAGYLTVNFSFSHSNVSIFGTASGSGSFSANRLPKPPGTPPEPTYEGRTPTSLTFTIAPPSDNGGSAITTYNMVVYNVSSGGSPILSWSSGSSSQTTPGTLDSNKDYWVAYRAVNAIGASSYTSRVKMTTAAGTPSAPRSPSASDLSPTAVTVSWLAPSSNGGASITGYTIQRATNSAFTQGLTQFTQGATLSRTFSDMLPSTACYFRIRATNSAGSGAYSSTLTVETVSGAYVSHSGAWQPCGIFVSVDGTWEACEVFVSDGTDWVAAT